MPADTATVRPAKSAESRRAADRLETTSEAAETLAGAGDALKHVSREYFALYAESLQAAMASANESSRVARELSQTCLDAWTSQAQAMTTFGRDMLTCKTPADVVRVQQQAFESSSRSFDSLVKLQEGVFTSVSKAMEPVLAQASKSPGRLFGALAD